MFDGKRFLPETGIPIWKSARRSTVLELCEPEPLAVRITTGIGTAWPTATSNS